MALGEPLDGAPEAGVVEGEAGDVEAFVGVGGSHGAGEGIGVAPGRSCPMPAPSMIEFGTRSTPSSLMTVT